MLTCVTLGVSLPVEEGRFEMAEAVRVQVLMSPEEAERFERYCREKGHKKSTLIARLVRDHLDREQFRPQRELFTDGQPGERA